ncbi:MAG: hypothetical protein JSS87_14360 [Acidobacteria bacterium]|nr:hypothetical protein [Acidobacteriota bacterium]
MIVPSAPQLSKLLMYVGKPLAYLLVYDILVVLAYNVMGWTWIGLEHMPLTLFGSAIGIVLSFRNAQAYDRWWEARKLWGSIVNNTRSWARQVMCISVPGNEPLVRLMQNELLYEQMAWTHALRQHLRGLEPWDAIAPFLPAERVEELKREKNVPLALHVAMGQRIAERCRAGWYDTLTWSQMDDTLNDLADAQGGCERIKNTPFPKQYDYFPRLFVHMFCLLLPLAMAPTMGWRSPLGSTLVGFIFLALDKIGRDLETPFDNKIYDVPMTAISTMIEINLRQTLGETELPQPVKPIHGVLW